MELSFKKSVLLFNLLQKAVIKHEKKVMAYDFDNGSYLVLIYPKEKKCAKRK